MQAIQQKGYIRIVTGMEGDRVCVTIEDNGCGIAPEVLPKIFDPFFTTKLGKGGSGLGLHIVYVTVSRILGGTITVDSTPGTGTTFRLKVPCIAPISVKTSATA